MATGFLLLAAVTSAAQAAPADDWSRVAIMCDPVKYRFSIQANATAASLDKSYPIAKLLSVEDLFSAEALPGWTSDGEVLAPLIHYERCGPYTFKFEGDALNMHVQGESGAYDPFAAVSILRGPGQFQLTAGSTLRLTACDRTLPRAAPCPKGSAVRLDGAYDDIRKQLRFVVTSTSYQYEPDNAAKTNVEHIDRDDDLEVWGMNDGRAGVGKCATVGGACPGA